MRWYSVKEYKPAIKKMMYVVRLSNGKVYIAKLEGNEELNWVSDDDKYFDDYPITHFCILDPVRVDE